MTSFDALFVGAATLDALALVDGFPAPDERVEAEQIVYAGGGPAATAAVAAARLGIRAAFLGTVGDDANGRSIIDGLADEGVDVSGVAVRAGAPSAASVVVVDRPHGTRAICNRPGPALDLAAGAALLEKARIVHVDHAGWGPIQQAGVPAEALVSVDAGNIIPGFTPAGVGMFVPTVEALRRTYGDLDIDELLGRAIDGGCDSVIATDGARGSYALTRDGRRAFAPAHPLEVLSTLGAGDVFHGALVAAVVHGLPLQQRLECANVTAALACRGLDGRSAIPTWTAVSELMSTPPSVPDSSRTEPT